MVSGKTGAWYGWYSTGCPAPPWASPVDRAPARPQVGQTARRRRGADPPGLRSASSIWPPVPLAGLSRPSKTSRRTGPGRPLCGSSGARARPRCVTRRRSGAGRRRGAVSQVARSPRAALAQPEPAGGVYIPCPRVPVAQPGATHGLPDGPRRLTGRESNEQAAHRARHRMFRTRAGRAARWRRRGLGHERAMADHDQVRWSVLVAKQYAPQRGWGLGPSPESARRLLRRAAIGPVAGPATSSRHSRGPPGAPAAQAPARPDRGLEPLRRLVGLAGSGERDPHGVAQRTRIAAVVPTIGRRAAKNWTGGA